MDDLSVDQKKKKRSIKKEEHFFDYADEMKDDDLKETIDEEGLDIKEIEDMAAYFASKSREKKARKDRYRKAKYLRHKGLFYTSRFFLLFHFLINVIFWILVIFMPLVAVIDCSLGFAWMTHVSIGVFLTLIFFFDLVFLSQYMDRMSMRFDLKSFKNGVYNKEGKCNFMLVIFIEALFEIFMT